ncbi:MAG: type III pantothenate kinase [Candidatus Brocadiia bacterium]|nr:MAG: type III pantothenate kinase [Candidatus Brocadiia bacterium]
MNIIAVDIGNTNITAALYINDEEKIIESMPGTSSEKLERFIVSAWEQIPVSRSSKEKKREGVIVVSSVKPSWTEVLEQTAREKLGERIFLVGKDIPIPMDMWVDEPEKVGTDRVVAAAAAYAVVEDAVVVADFGTAVTIDLVSDTGVFLGGVICPGFEISAKALHENTAQLPMVKTAKPQDKPYGKNTIEAINNGLYYSAVGTLQEVIRRYAEEIGKWPRTIITGSGAKIIKDDCDFIDTFVTNLPVRGIILAYKKFIEQKE